MNHEVFYFGCCDYPGHAIHGKVRRDIHCRQTPWGAKLDARLLTEDDYSANTSPTGKYVEHHKDGWTAVAFWDQSGDDRPGSNSVFLVAAEMTGEELINLARLQWPEIFSRHGFPRLSPAAKESKP